MNIFDGANFIVDDVALTSAGIQRKKLIYMNECFPPNVPRDRVYTEWVSELGASYQGHFDLCIDIEDTGGETVVWNLRKDETRQGGVALWIEFMEAFRAGYGAAGRLGSYGGHADWMDFFQFLMRRGWTDATQNKFDYFSNWEYELQPMMRMMDTCYPSIYGQWERFNFGGDQGNGNYDYDSYKVLQANCYRQIVNAISMYHDKPIEWFVTDNKRGDMYPPGTFDWILRELEQYGYPAVGWNASSYMPKWTDATVGTMLKHFGR